jgi:biotin carboxyl carrier protein
MKVLARVQGRSLALEVRAAGPAYVVELGSRRLHVEAHFEGPFLTLVIDGRRHELGLVRSGAAFTVTGADGAFEVETAAAGRGVLAAPHHAAAAGPARLAAPMPGKVVRVLVAPGQEVREGQGLVVVEAMKMENELRAPRAGRVVDLPAREGQAVESGALLAVVG